MTVVNCGTGGNVRQVFRRERILKNEMLARASRTHVQAIHVRLESAADVIHGISLPNGAVIFMILL